MRPVPVNLTKVLRLEWGSSRPSAPERPKDGLPSAPKRPKTPGRGAEDSEATCHNLQADDGDAAQCPKRRFCGARNL